MTTVTLNDVDDAAPAPAIVAVAAAPDGVAITRIDDKTATVRDVQGRTLRVKRLSAVEKMRLAKALGEFNTNELYANYGWIAAAVREIDGLPVVFPMNNLQLEATVQRLDDDGMDAAMRAVFAVNAPALDKDAVKNL